MQVGTVYPTHKSDRDSSLEVIVGPGIYWPNVNRSYHLVNEVIDNSIDVGADTIEIYYNYDKVNHDRYLMIVDNGEGMTEPQIQNAMMLGSNRKRNDNAGTCI